MSILESVYKEISFHWKKIIYLKITLKNRSEELVEFIFCHNLQFQASQKLRKRNFQVYLHRTYSYLWTKAAYTTPRLLSLIPMKFCHHIINAFHNRNLITIAIQKFNFHSLISECKTIRKQTAQGFKLIEWQKKDLNLTFWVIKYLLAINSNLTN